MKAIIHASHRREVLQEAGRGVNQCCIRRKFSEPVMFWMWTNAISKGRDPTKV